MILTAETKPFRAAMQTVGRVVPAKSPWPILTNLKLVTNDDRVTLIGSDGDMTVEADVPANVETEGVACIPFAPLAKFIGAAKADLVKISMDGNAAKVSASRSRIALSAWPVDDYPNYRPPEGEPVTLDRDSFVAALRFAVAAAEDDEVRYHIAGPNISEKPGQVDFWGTDGKSAHHATLHGIDAIGGGGTLPMSAAMVILAAAEKAESVAFMICARGWHLATPGLRLWGKVIDGQYPDMERVISQFEDWSEITIAANDDLSAALSVASCGAEQDSGKSRNLILRAREGEPIVLRGQKAMGGVLAAGRAEMEAEGQMEFAGAISAKYLSAAVAGIPEKDLAIEGCVQEGSAIGKAIRVKPAQSSNTLDMSALIMALRVSEAEMADV